ncbi:hypothetical protein PLICRDRAFT_165126 [Plicaturopsis crispa FD-325 SS-3]|nr:hypothetical protein PLICRDRAFT_165126 [Plicaturopsis crispa FD-325 SS-3]
MLQLRSLRSASTARRFLARSNATLSVEATPESAPPPLASDKPVPPHLQLQPQTESTPLRRVKKLKHPTKRPPISLDRPREWNRPIPVGVIPAYDLALEYLKRDADALRAELEQVRAQAAKAEGEEAEQLLEKARILEVQSEINLPDVRWKTANGMADLSKPVYRHLVEQRWRSEGALDLLMERIYQMNVVPDVLPELHPSFDLRINFPEGVAPGQYVKSSAWKPVEPGVYLLPQQTRHSPRLFTTVFHTDTRLYTLLMVDPDFPDEEVQGFQNFLHWMQPNIPLSSSSSAIPSSIFTHTPYIPPHPQRGTKYHRYVLLLLPQSSEITVPRLVRGERLRFDVRGFMEKYGLDGAKGGGAHMWREVWDEDVSKIYSDILKAEEPRYGQIPRRVEYQRPKKYI